MEQLQSGRGVLFVIFELRPLATKSEKWQFGLVFVLMKGKRYVFFVLKTDKGELKVFIKEKRVLKILSKILVVIFYFLPLSIKSRVLKRCAC